MNLVQQKVPLRAVMAIFQKDPQVLISHPRHDLNSLAEMNGQPILISAATMTSFWPWLRAKFGFQDTQIRKYTYNLAPFLVDPNAIQEGYLTSEPYTIAATGAFHAQGFPAGRLRLSRLRQHGAGAAEMDRYQSQGGAGLLRRHQATAGCDYLNRDPAPGNALIKRDNPDMTDAIIAQSIAKMKQYQLVTGGDAPAFGVGAHDRQALARFLPDHGGAKGFIPRAWITPRPMTCASCATRFRISNEPADACACRQALRQRHRRRCRDLSFAIAAGRICFPAGPQRLRQIHGAAPDRRTDRAGQRRRSPGRGARPELGFVFQEADPDALGRCPDQCAPAAGFETACRAAKPMHAPRRRWRGWA